MRNTVIKAIYQNRNFLARKLTQIFKNFKYFQHKLLKNLGYNFSVPV
jgi:hypothetical protein